MSDILWIVLCLVCLRSVASSAVLYCSDSHGCVGDVIRCQCQDDQTTTLAWRVFRPDMITRVYGSLTYNAGSEVGSPSTQGAYSAILNSTDPLSSQLTITLMTQEPELLVRCDTNTLSIFTVHIIEALPRRPTSLDMRIHPTVSSSVTLMLWWAFPMEYSAALVTGYLINITELVTGLTQQLSSTNTSVTTQLNTAGEYLVQVVAVNCAGTSQGRAAILFNITEPCLLLRDCGQQQTTTDFTTTFLTTIATATINNQETDRKLISSISTPPTAATKRGCVENWHIGIAVACIAAIQVICTTICITTTMVLKNKRAVTKEQVSPGHSGHVKGEPLYEDILPQAKDKEGAVTLEQNVAYSAFISSSN